MTSYQYHQLVFELWLAAAAIMYSKYRVSQILIWTGVLFSAFLCIIDMGHRVLDLLGVPK